MSVNTGSLTFVLYHAYTAEEMLDLHLIEDGYMRIKAPADGPSNYNVFQRDTDFNYGSYRITEANVGAITLIAGKRMETPESGNEFIYTDGWEFDTVAQITTTGMLNRLQRNVIQIAKAMEITLDDTTQMLNSALS